MEENPKIAGNKLIFGGYVYVKKKVSNKTYKNCRLVRRKMCKARAITTPINKEVIVLTGPDKSAHPHPPNQEEPNAEIVVRKLKRKAEEHPEVPPAQIPRQELRNVPCGVLSSMLPERENLNKKKRCEGNAGRICPRAPNHCQNYKIFSTDSIKPWMARNSLFTRLIVK